MAKILKLQMLGLYKPKFIQSVLLVVAKTAVIVPTANLSNRLSLLLTLVSLGLLRPRDILVSVPYVTVRPEILILLRS